MVASSVLSSSIYTRGRTVNSRVRTYNWPPIQLNFWIFVMLLASSSILGVFSIFVQTQNQLLLPTPWYDEPLRPPRKEVVGITVWMEFANLSRICRYFPYYITVAGLTIVFILVLFWLIAQRRLLPAIVMIGAFILFVLWITGLIVTSIELFGPSGSISSNCDLEVFDRNPKGQTVEVLAYLQQKNICA